MPCSNRLFLLLGVIKYTYHVDSLLQLSEVCRINEDFQMAAELIGGLSLTLFQFCATEEGQPHSTNVYSYVDLDFFSRK